jgi:ABC-2 type transport system ATP-binding protein
VNNPPSDAPGTFAAFTSPVLKSPAEVVGSPCVTLHLTAPVAAQSQAGGPSGQLVLFAKVYDVAPDGTKVLKNRLIAPMRVSDVTRTVNIKLPGIVHRFATGHRIQVAVAASDAAYANNTVPQPVTITTSPLAPSTLTLPLTSALGF